MPQLDDDLIDLVLNNDGVKRLLDELNKLTENIERAVMSCNVLEQGDIGRLTRLKYEAQGARKLYSAFKQFLLDTRLTALKVDKLETDKQPRNGRTKWAMKPKRKLRHSMKQNPS